MMKNSIYLILVAFLVLSSCDNSENNTAQPDTETHVEFTNLEQYKVILYADSSMNNIFVEIAANSTKTVPATPNNASVAYYPVYYIDIPDIPDTSIPYTGQAIITAIEANKINKVFIPPLVNIVINTAYLKITNDSIYSLSLRQGNTEKIPLGGSLSIIAAGQNAAYEITPGPSSSYTVMRNTTDPVAFPAGFTEFERGNVYLFTYDGTNLVLTATLPIPLSPSAVYNGFYNYPVGRVDAGGLLTISNTANSAALLFTGSVDGVNYIGTVDAQKSVKIKLPEEKFYSVIAVDKAAYEEITSRAPHYTILVRYSNSLSYQASVSPANIPGNAQWIMNNYSAYWIQVKSPDMETTYAVLPPLSLNVSIPINYDVDYYYIPVYSWELKYNGKAVALIEFNDAAQADLAQCTVNSPTFRTNFNNPVSAVSIQPTVLVVNNSSRSIRAYYASLLLTNGYDDLVILSGTQELLTGFNAGSNTNMINFSSPAWGTNKLVTQDFYMLTNKVYQITIGFDENSITVVELDASEFYN